VHTPFVRWFRQKELSGKEAEAMAKLSASQTHCRMAQPSEVCPPWHSILLDEASFVTGTDYPLDGGFFNLHG